MNKPHKHAATIKAWADGAEIEYFDEKLGLWYYTHNPSWSEYIKYRVKPLEYELDVSVYLPGCSKYAFVRFTVDETLKQPIDAKLLRVLDLKKESSCSSI